MRVLKALFIILFFINCSTTSSETTTGSTPNTPAPEFTHVSLDGGEISLSNFRGQVVYMFFYGAGCPHCRTNGPVTESVINQAFDSNPNFVALGLDTWNQSASNNQSFRSATGITYPLLLNARETLVNYYGSSSAYDRSVVIDPNGNIVYQGNDFVNTDANAVVNVVQEQLNALQN